jgi:hypothetical protein
MKSKDQKLLAEAYDKVQGISSEQSPLPATHGEGGYEGKEITLQHLFQYNSDNDSEDTYDLLYKGVSSKQISYETFTEFMRSFNG